MSDSILVKDKEIVVPGQILARGMGILPSQGTYRKDEEVISEVVGIANVKGRVIKIIPLSGVYIPTRNDMVVGIIKEVIPQVGWVVDINTYQTAILPLSHMNRFVRKDELRKILDKGDFVLAEVIDSRNGSLAVSLKNQNAKVLKGGVVMNISPTKVPRLIGKKGSMISVIKRNTKCYIEVGKNGYIWVKGSPEKILIVHKAINYINENPLMSGLTDYIDNLTKGGING